MPPTEPSPPTLDDQEPEIATFRAEVAAGLRARPKTLPCKYFYDAEGSRLFDAICELPEYYPTRTELSIMRESASEMATALGRGVRLVEYGSGSSTKTRILLAALEEPAAYVPVDISREHLLAESARLADEMPQLVILPLCGDFTVELELPEPPTPAKRTAVYFPGSTIGNFERDAAAALLRVVREEVGAGGALLIGVDLRKDEERLVRAYDDAAGVTAAFNKNLLVHVNRELGADFELDGFRHEARWVDDPGRVEMHLVSQRAQTVTLAGERFDFEAGESICTEHSHKYTLEDFAALAASAGFEVTRVWTDPEALFSVQLLTGRP